MTRSQRVGRYLLRLALAMAVVVLAVWGVRQLWRIAVAPHLKSPAARAVEEQAQASGKDMFAVGNDRSADYVARKVLRDAGYGNVVQVLRADGSAHDGQIVLRIAVQINSGGFLGSSSAGCYEYHLSSVRADETPQEITCPRTPVPLTFPSLDPDPTPTLVPTPHPQLPNDAVTRLTKALARVPKADQRDPEAVRSSVTKAFTATPGAAVDVGTAPDGTVGVAVTVDGSQDCLAGRLLDSPDVWVPPRILIQPGEYGCRAQVFAAGLAKHAPH